MELLLIRHALPVRVEGDSPADPGLTDLGRRQAEALAAWLADEPIDAVYSSPMRRARETAAPLAAGHGRSVMIDEELAEFDQGEHFYIPLEELKASGDPRLAAVIEGRWGPGGEVGAVDPETFRAVVVEAVERVVAAHPGGRVALVAHGGVINAYLSSVLGIERVLFFDATYTGISRVLAARSGTRTVQCMNETAHLRPLRPVAETAR